MWGFNLMERVKTDTEVIEEVLFELVDVETLENGTIEDIERFINSVIALGLIEQGDPEDE